MKPVNRNFRLFFGWPIRWIVFLASCWFIFLHLRKEAGVLDHAASLIILSYGNHTAYELVLLLGLCLLNWGLEALKWKQLIAVVERVTFGRAMRAFFSGVTVSFFTPNRSGEFAGRILYLAPGHRVGGALIGVIGSSAQLLVTLQAGLLATAWQWPELSGVNSVYPALAAMVICTWTWFSIPSIVRWTDRLPWPVRWKQEFHIFDRVSLRNRLAAWGLSVLRYCTFSFQQVLIYRLLGFELPVSQLLVLIAASFLLMTVIPSIAWGELGVRGSVNILLFGAAGAATSLVLAATISLWLINVALPALFGALSVLFMKGRLGFKQGS